MADAAWHILTNTSGATGNFYIDDAVLQAHGVTDLDRYAVTPGNTVFCPICLWIDGAARHTATNRATRYITTGSVTRAMAVDTAMLAVTSASATS